MTSFHPRSHYFALCRLTIRVFSIVAIAILAFCVSRAQDVTITLRDYKEGGAAAAHDAPTKILEGKWRSLYPAVLIDAPVHGYAFVLVKRDAKGQCTPSSLAATNSVFRRSLSWRELSKDIESALAPKGDAPKESWFWLTRIFNPKTASDKNADSVPRLLEVFPVIVPEDADKILQNRNVVWAHIGVSEKGRITEVNLEAAYEFASPYFPQITQALKQWKFAPAKNGGAPVASQVVMPLCFITQHTLDLAVHKPSANRQNPRPLGTPAAPEYPLSLKRLGLNGEAQVSFVINKQGKVSDAVVLRTSHPLFGDAALGAVRKWKYSPVMENGEPVEFPMTIPIAFQLGDSEQADKSRLLDKKTQEALPPQFRFDVAPRSHFDDVPMYPHELLPDKKLKGEVEVIVLIDEWGGVAEAKIRRATHPEFGQAMLAAVSRHKYEPALRNGRQTATLQVYRHTFNRDENSNLSAKSLKLLSLEQKQSENIFSAEALDEQPKELSPLKLTTPMPLKRLGMTTGASEVEFLLDEDGRVHLPRAVSASSPEFGYAAVQAVAYRYFGLARKNGKPVTARLRIAVEFSD